MLDIGDQHRRGTCQIDERVFKGMHEGDSYYLATTAQAYLIRFEPNDIVALDYAIAKVVGADASRHSIDRRAGRGPMTKMLATTFAVIALPTLAAAEWQVDTEISPIDDSQTVKLSTPALDQFVDDFGQLIRPVLVTACQEGETVTYVYWYTFLSTDDIVVTYRVDKEPAKQQLWQVTSDFKGAGFFRAGPPIGLVRQMSGHERLYVQVTPYGSASVDAVFDISGIDEAAKPLMEACDWTMDGLHR